MAPFHETNGERLAGGSTRGSGFLLKLLCGADSGKKLGDNTVLDSYQQRVPPTHDSRSTLDILALERRRRSVESEASGELLSTDSDSREDVEDRPVRCIAGSTSVILVPGEGLSHLAHPASSRCRKSQSFPRMSSPGLLGKIGKVGGGKPLKVLVLGQAAVGKTALTVRFITKRFIGEYDPTLERKYAFQSEIDNESAQFEIFDTAGQAEDALHLEENIRWADAYILVYSVTDRCSFDECTRLKFLINHCKRSRRSSPSVLSNSSHYIPAVLVGNQNDLEHDRMVNFEEGQKRAENLGCTGFYDISVRESYEEVREVFHDLYIQCKFNRKLIKAGSPPLTRGLSSSVLPPMMDDRHMASLSDNENTGSSASVKRKPSVSKRLMRKVFKQDSFFKDSVTKLDASSELKEDSGQDSV